MALGPRAFIRSATSRGETEGIRQYLTALFNLVAFLTCAVLMEETNFDRKQPAPTTQAVAPGSDEKDGETEVSDPANAQEQAWLPNRPKSFLQRLKPFHLPAKRPPIWPCLWRPFYLLSFPVIAFSALQYGSGLCIYSVYNATASLVFSGAPYHFKPAMIGLTFFGPLLVRNLRLRCCRCLAIPTGWSGRYYHRRAFERLACPTSSATQWRRARVRASTMASGVRDHLRADCLNSVGCRSRT